jgi:ABC-type lipoprotein release transport system permease subunit
VLLGLAFSISVILSTIGIMDGFESTLRKGLKTTLGDLYVFSRNGFFYHDEVLHEELLGLGVTEQTAFVKTEGFAIVGEESKGVIVKGVVPETYSSVTGIKLNLNQGEVALGYELSKALKVKEKDFIALALASGNKEFSGLPILKRFKVGQIVKHTVYQKDVRSLYLNYKDLNNSLNLNGRSNVVALNIPTSFRKNTTALPEEIKDFRREIMEVTSFDFIVRPYWTEFSSLITAVKSEKVMIGLIFQLVVIISIFNVLAFIIYLNERKVREIFLFKALGMSQQRVFRLWFFLISGLWVCACIISLGFVNLFDYGLAHLSLLELPRDVYHLGRISIKLKLTDYILVFSLSYVWLFLVSWLGLRKIKNKPILAGLRKEFA